VVVVFPELFSGFVSTADFVGWLVVRSQCGDYMFAVAACIVFALCGVYVVCVWDDENSGSRVAGTKMRVGV
jgi:hypothetical protein